MTPVNGARDGREHTKEGSDMPKTECPNCHKVSYGWATACPYCNADLSTTQPEES
jgi:hypothetical protein